MLNVSLLKRRAFCLGAFLQFIEEADEPTLLLLQDFLNEAAGEDLATGVRAMQSTAARASETA